MKQLFKTSLGFSVVLSSLATTVTAQTLEEVVVTAQKREQAITDVSIAMNAFTAEDMRSFRVEDATDIAQLLSNIDIKGTLGGVNPAITLRGVGLNDFNANNNPQWVCTSTRYSWHHPRCSMPACLMWSASRC